jgi:hypothetical protein
MQKNSIPVPKFLQLIQREQFIKHIILHYVLLHTGHDTNCP